MSTTAHVDTFVIDGLPPKEQWPDLALDEPGYQLPDRLNAAAELLDKAIEGGWGDRPCMTLGEVSWTYAEMLDWSNRMAAVLVEDYGVVAGNRVLVRGPNAPWVAAAWFATLKAGAVAVLTMPLLRQPELLKVANKCYPTVALCQADMVDELTGAVDCPITVWDDADLGASHPGRDGASLVAAAKAKSGEFTTVDTAADDPALLGFTSGTTGDPKAAIHFHRDVMFMIKTVGPLLDAGPDDVFVGSPPLAFTFGLGGLVGIPMAAGASTVFTAAPGPGALCSVIEQHRATICFTAPTAYRAILDLDDRPDISSLRGCVSAGETLPLSTFERFRDATGLSLIDGLGATEMLHIFIAAAGEDIRPGATGKALPGYQAKILDDDGNEAPDGEVGRLAVKGPIGCRYLDDERQTVYVENGWNMTGDAYVRDADGYFWYQARADDMIISAGYNIGAPEVEQALIEHPAVAEAGVIGSPDPDRGMIVHGFVHLAAGFEASDELARELQDHVKATIAPYKYPRQITFSTAPLPKTATGKLQRRALSD